MATYFVSDIHLKDPGEANAKALVAFLQRIRQPETRLFLVGDIFDLWVGSHEFFRKRFEDLVDALHDLVRVGARVHYFEGNHDLYLDEFWGKEIGAEIHGDAEYFEIEGKIVRVEHGDKMNPNDRGYLFLRWLLRTPPIRRLAVGLPSTIVTDIGERASRASRGYTSNTGSKAMPPQAVIQLIRAHAEKTYRERVFDLIVTGHVHVVDDHSFAPEGAGKLVRSVNLGSWFDKPRVFELSKTRAEFIDL